MLQGRLGLEVCNEFLYGHDHRLVVSTADIDSVKQFIRSVRASKTIADERAVVQKESAAIRASFREESGDANIRSSRIL